jgi:peptidoglycan/LPS O-acetylase OafA/YrhL
MTVPMHRFHSMDALRGSAMLLVVPIHAAALLSQNGHPGAWATAVYWVIHFFRLPLFFAMSGFFAVALVGRKGLRVTAGNRAVRIGGPLLLGLFTVLPLTLVLGELTGTVLVNGEEAPFGNPFTFEPGLLWFLWYLLLINGIGLILHLYAPRLLTASGRLFRASVAHPLGGILLLSLPTVLMLWSAVSWTAEAPAQTFMPAPGLLVYYGLFFALGATLGRYRELIGAVSRSAWHWTACAAAATVPAGLLFSLHNSPAYSGRLDVHAAALLLYAMATWCTLIALIGLATRYVTREWRPVRYVADASYWIYLSHMPAVVVLVPLAGMTALGTAPEFALVTLGAAAASLLTYPVLVRGTVIGRLLNGTPKRPHPKSPGLTLRGLPG